MGANDVYRTYASMSAADATASLGVTLSGLSPEAVEASREKSGRNVIVRERRETTAEKLVKAFVSPFTFVLLLLACISFFTDVFVMPSGQKDASASIIILVMVAVSGTMSFVQSVRSSSAADKLTSMVKTVAAVVRPGISEELSIEEIVCGDIVRLSAGDMIPADMRIVQSKDLFISQAAMTGESEPVEKFSEPETGLDKLAKPVTEYSNIVFMGSNVVSGSALAVVIAVGNDTQFGLIAEGVAKQKAETNFDRGIRSVSWLLIRFMAVMAPTVFVINGLTKGDWLQAFLFGLSIAVGLTPEMLPMIVTTNLVKGTMEMSKRGTVIKNVGSIQNFGAIDILCTDKTGTLTQDRIVLEYHLDATGKEDPRVLRHAYLNSYYQTGLKNLMDVSIIEAADRELKIDKSFYEKVDEIPFDFRRRRMSVVVRDGDGKTQMITKGAVEEMLEISSFVDYEGSVRPLSAELKDRILHTVDGLNEDGLRVIAVSQRTNPPEAGEFCVADERDMVLIGYLAFLDPPKETARPALKVLGEHGVRVKILTGDNELVTRSVCTQVGLDVQHVLSGADLDGMSDSARRSAVEACDVFVKLSPQQKTEVIETLRGLGHVVGFMGDGINDAPAMKEADVAISVDTAVDIAKESADIILLGKDLMILENGIVSGREIFGNIMKYTKMTASSNFGNMFSVLIASYFLPFLPMMPIQVLALNLIYDITCVSLPWDNMDREYLRKPRKWDASSIGAFMRWFGPTSSVFDITTYLLMYFVICPQVLGGSYHSLASDKQLWFVALFNAGWFIESLWSQTLVIHALRTPKIPFIHSHASFIVTVVTALGIASGSYIVYTNLGIRLDMAPLPANYYGWLGLTIIGYLALVTVCKKAYIARHGELL